MSFTAPITQMGEDAYNYLEPLWADDDQRGYPLKTLVAGLCEAFRQVEEVSRSVVHPDPFQDAWDVNTTQTYLLPFLGFAVGVNVTDGLTDPQQRQQIRAEQGFYRGSPQNLLAAAEAQQTQANRTTLLERVPDADSITISYDPTYTPDITAYENAASAAVAWGLQVYFASSSSPFFEEASAAKTFEAVSSSVTFESATLTDIS